MNSTIRKTNFQIYNASAGSGKTYTLVAEYIKILFQTESTYGFKHILAITFTNKAAAEMKSRVLDTLQEFSNPDILNNETALFKKIYSELHIEPLQVHKKSIQIIKNILNNYAAFNITTIDSFTYKLIRSFAFDLGISLNFEIEMDAVSLLNETVDVLISRIGDHKLLTKTLIDFSISKSLEDKSWDIAIDLKEIATLLLNENDILQVNKIKQKPLDDFLNLQKKIRRQIEDIESQFLEIGFTAMQIIKSEHLSSKNFTYGDLPNHFKKIVDLRLDALKFDGRLNNNIESNHPQYSSKANAETRQKIDRIRDELTDLYFESKALHALEYATYLLNKLIDKSLIPLAVLQSINAVLTEIKEDNNIRLLSEFNQIISNHLKEQPVAFIYEKIGERFQHYFIDEMQDTSTMQWENLIPLLDNVLSGESVTEETGSLLLVGDAKQAIYRWRGGKAEQFIELTAAHGTNPFTVGKTINQLDTNWRSYSEIIDFNNAFFQHISKYLRNPSYQELYRIGNQQKHNTKQGGYVEIQYLPEGLNAEDRKELYPAKVLEIIQNLDNSFDKKDICILTRTRKQGVEIAEYLTKENIDIISSETLLLQNSPKINFIIHLLYFIKEPKDKDIQFEILLFLYDHFEIINDTHQFLSFFLETDDFLEQLKKLHVQFDLNYFNLLSLYESIEYIIRCFRLTKTSDAYLQFFLDVILNFSIQKTAGLDAFLEYWEDKKDSLSIVVSKEKDAIQITTIHKAKGLEFPIVIYPYDVNIYFQKNATSWYTPLDKNSYNGFDSMLVSNSKALENVGYIGKELYNKQQEELELDNFNLLYVALTRAKEQLYIVNEHKTQRDEPKWYSHFFTDYLKDIGVWHPEKSVYTFGDAKRVSIKQEQENTNIEQTTFISSDWRQHNINIVPTQPEVEDIEREKAKEFGNLVHLILSKIRVAEDLDSVLQGFIGKGLVALTDKDLIRNRVLKTLTHPLLKDYFSEDYTIMNEREILDATGEIIIPDRLAFKNNDVVVMDYKTGKPEKSHYRQVNNYAFMLKQMNFNVSKKLLIYIDDAVDVVAF